MSKTLSAVFNKKCEFLIGAQSVDQIPQTYRDMPEIAFIGRSNVGKSSLINAITGIDGLARVSKSPGRTQQINFFSLNNTAILADLPGYGYAEVSKKMRKIWDRLILDYLCGRAQLKKSFILIDSRRGIKDIDKEVMDILDHNAVPYQIILTKTDAVSDTVSVEQALIQDTKKFIAIHPTILKSSSKNNDGINEIRAVIMDIINQK